MSKIGALLTKAFLEANAQHADVRKKWIAISTRIGGLLPESLLMTSIQREGELDCVLRSMESELAEQMQTQSENCLFHGHYQNILSSYWIGGIYETMRLLRSRELMKRDDEFEGLFTCFELLRIQIDKHEITKDRELKAPFKMQRYPPNNDKKDDFIYDPEDEKRAHIPISGVAENGSIVWQVIDIRNKQSYWLERQSLSDQLIQLWSSNVIAG